MDFFIAYNGADHQWAEWIGACLEQASYSVELQSWDYWARSSLILEMFAVSSIAESTIAVLSPDFLKDNLKRPEWSAAYAQDPTGERGLLIPALVRRCDLEALPQNLSFIDLLGLEDEVAAATLLAEVKERRGLPA